MAPNRNDPRWDVSGMTGPGDDPEADWPTNPGFARPYFGAQGFRGPGTPAPYSVPPMAPARTGGYRTPPARKRPGLFLIVVVTLVFGPFGALPAASSASTARRRGFPVLRYWVTFLVVWAIQLMALVVLVLSWLGGGFASTPDSTAIQTGAAATTQPPAATSAAPAATSAAAPQTQASSPAQSASFPAGATSCGTNTAVNARTSCQFAAKVSDAYRTAGSPASVNLEVTSPVTGQSYAMACTSSAGLVTCAGGNDAVVYLR